MKMFLVRSSSIVAVGYDEQTLTLRLKFNHGAYDYFGVPKAFFTGLLTAPSKGRYYASFIKGRFPNTRL